MKQSSYHILRVLKAACPKLRTGIISNCDKGLVNDICECILNVLKRNINLTACSKRKLKKYKTVIRTLIDKRSPLSTKKRLIIQKGGFLLPLLTAVLQILANLIFRKASSNGSNSFPQEEWLYVKCTMCQGRGVPRPCFAPTSRIGPTARLKSSVWRNRSVWRKLRAWLSVWQNTYIPPINALPYARSCAKLGCENWD
jgi:hypothetical protein